jgi:hypothetical protein
VTWIALVPWDLSEVDSQGRLLEGGGDDHGGAIVLVACVVVMIGGVLLWRSSTRAIAAPFTFGGLAAWAVLFAWRAGTARTYGANMFMAPLIIIVIPAAILVPMAVAAIARRLSRAE